MDISIIIPSKDRAKILFESLERAYSAIEQITAEIIVINDSKTDQIQIKPEWSGKIKVFDNPKSGVASARNLGASKATADLILFMDDDMWIAKENILTILDLHKNIPLGQCINLNWVYPPALAKQMDNSQFGRYLRYYGFDSLQGWRRTTSWDSKQLFPVEGITSQNLSIKKADFDKTSGYNENFPHAGFEDHDFSIRLASCGVQAYIYPLSIMHHNEADRMDVESWLARKRRGAETRCVAVKMGYSELTLRYSFLKTLIYKLLMPFQPVLVSFLRLIPNITLFDFFYFKLLNTLLGTASFEGYHKLKK